MRTERTAGRESRNDDVGGGRLAPFSGVGHGGISFGRSNHGIGGDVDAAGAFENLFVDRAQISFAKFEEAHGVSVAIYRVAVRKLVVRGEAGG